MITKPTNMPLKLVILLLTYLRDSFYPEGTSAHPTPTQDTKFENEILLSSFKYNTIQIINIILVQGGLRKESFEMGSCRCGHFASATRS